MQPIHELLNRIHWDPEFSRGHFELCFQDHTQQELIRKSFSNITFAPGDHYFFYYFDVEGNEHSIPFHRIKSVYKDGELIWHRE